MAQLLQAFDASQIKPDQGIGGLPVGKYPVVIESSEVKPTKGNDGGLVEFIVKATGGEHAGAVGAYRINLYNSSAQAVQIAQKQLSALCHVTGVFMLQDTTQLHGIPFIVEVQPQKNDPQYTEVKRVFDMNGNEPGKQGNAQSAIGQNTAQSNPVGGFGSNAPQGQGTPFNQQQQPAQSQQPAAWGQPQGQQAAPQQQQAPAWGQGQQQPQQPAAQGWQQNNGGNAGAAPWWQR